MDIKVKVLVIFFVMNFEGFLARKIDYYRRPQVSCRFLAHVYKFQWYRPHCNPDGSIKNPQCFKPGYGVQICCCTYKYPFFQQGIKWIGDCVKYETNSKPLCIGPKMISSYNISKGNSFIKGSAKRVSVGQKSDEEPEVQDEDETEDRKDKNKVAENSQKSEDKEHEAGKK